VVACHIFILCKTHILGHINISSFKVGISFSAFYFADFRLIDPSPDFNTDVKEQAVVSCYEL